MFYVLDAHADCLLADRSAFFYIRVGPIRLGPKYIYLAPMP